MPKIRVIFHPTKGIVEELVSAEGSGIIFENNAEPNSYIKYTPSDASNWSTVPDDIAEALDALASGSGGTGGITQLTGDVAAGPGTGLQIATVSRLQGNQVSAAAPADGNALVWNNSVSEWQPTALSSQVTSVGASSPLSSSGGTAPNLSLISGTTPGDVLTWDGSVWASSPTAAAGITQLTGDVTSGPGSGSQTATVVALQGNAISTSSPVDGQVLTWNGTAWVPGANASGGSGGGGQVYFFNAGTPAQIPTASLPGTPSEFGLTAEVAATFITSSILSTSGVYSLVAGFVTQPGSPGLNAIPAGLWDFNVWARSTGINPNTVQYKVGVYSYNGVSSPTLIASSSALPIYDPTQLNQYALSLTVPQTSILTSDRLYVEIEGTATSGSQQLIVGFGDGSPSHAHTTLPSVAGTGIVHVINGVFQSPASPIDLSAGLSEVSGTLPVSRGGTGNNTSPATGSLLIGDGSGYTLSTLTAGTGVSISNGAGSITVNSSGMTALTGDVTATGPGSSAATVAKIQGYEVSTTAPTSNQILQWIAGTSKWTPTANGVGLGSKILLVVEGGAYATVQAAIDAASDWDVILVGPKAAGASWGPMTFSPGKRLSVIGFSHEGSTQVKVDSVTFNVSSGLNILLNTVLVKGLFINSSFVGTQGVNFYGSFPGRLRLQECFIYNSGATGTGVVSNNSGSGSSLTIDNSVVQSGAFGGIGLDHQQGYTTVRNDSEISRYQYPIQCAAGNLEILNTIIDNSGIANEAIRVSGGVVTVGYSTIKNTTTNASGVNLTTAGATLGMGDATFAIGTGTGYCVTGVGSTGFIYGRITYSNSLAAAYNVKVKNTVTAYAVTQTFTSSP